MKCAGQATAATCHSERDGSFNALIDNIVSMTMFDESDHTDHHQQVCDYLVIVMVWLRSISYHKFLTSLTCASVVHQRLTIIFQETSPLDFQG